MRGSLLSRLYRAAGSGDSPLLGPFTSAAFADLLESCPGLAARLFGDLGPIPPGTPEVSTHVQISTDVRLDILIEGENGFRLMIENRLAPDVEWFEERTEVRPSSHTDQYVAAARHHAGNARVLVLARTEHDAGKRKHPPDIFAGVKTWPVVYLEMQGALGEAADVHAHSIRQFLDFLKEHDMNPNEPLTPTDSDTILAFDRFARNNLKLLDDAVGRIRQEFDLKGTPNNRRLTGWYASSDRFQSEELHFFFYLMFPPVPDLVVRAAVQVTKESTPKGLTGAAEHGFRRGRWGSLWVERDFRRQHPFLGLTAQRQVEELVRFFQTPLGRLSKTGLVKLAPARHEPSRKEMPAEMTPRPATGNPAESVTPVTATGSRAESVTPRPAIGNPAESEPAPPPAVEAPESHELPTA